MCFVYEQGDVVEIIDPDEGLVDKDGELVEYGIIYQSQDSGYLIYPLNIDDVEEVFNASDFDFSELDLEKDLVFCENNFIYPMF